MGQYYQIVNVTRKEFLDPHRFGDGLKLMEFGPSGDGVMAGLAILLSNGNGGGGGDLDSDNPIIGSWAGDRIVIAGDYSDTPSKDFGVKSNENLYQLTRTPKFKDVSFDVINALCDDEYTRKAFADKLVQFTGETNTGIFGIGNDMPQELKDKIMRGFKIVKDKKNKGFFKVEKLLDNL